MNHHITNTIFPILIFLFWVIISAVANKRKKNLPQRPRQDQATTREEDREYEPESGPAEGSSGEPQGASDELKRTLEGIFTEVGLPPPAPERREESASPRIENFPETARVEPAPLQKGTPDVAPGVSAQAFPVPRALADASKGAPMPGTVPEVSPAEMLALLPIEPDSPDEVRKGIIWSEILREPVSLREDRRF